MAHKIIQWNCRGLRSNYNDLAILLQEHNPSAVCLQETNLKPNTNISFKSYSIINCFGPANNERACWGVSILVKDGTPHQQITLNTTLQAVAVNINCHRARIGHAYFTNEYLLRGELRPMCCNTRLTVRHVLLSCAKYAHIRRKYFAFNSLFELFRDTPAGFIIQFLQECNLYYMF